MGWQTSHTYVISSDHLQEDAACTFSPDTAASQPVLALAAHPHGQETYLERVERLAFKDKQRQDACRSATADHYYAQFSFKPQINERSRRIARVRDQCTLLWGDRGGAWPPCLPLAAASSSLCASGQRRSSCVPWAGHAG